jgi:hypothetical protein
MERNEESATPPASPASESRWEVRGGGWEMFHVAVFYAAVLNAVLATAGVLRLFTGLASAFLLFYSMLAIFSSPTYASLEDGKGLALVKYRFFLPRREFIPAGELSRIVVEETEVAPFISGRYSQHLYLARVFVEDRDGGRYRVFRTHLNGTPAHNREETYLVAELLARSLNLPVIHARKARGFRDPNGP